MTSKLAQMQARFQQKQMQEKEEKLLKLYENQQQRTFERMGRGSAGSNTSTARIGSTGGGKERRQKAGIDKSYPLEPLKTKTTSSTTGRTTVVKAAIKKTVKHGQSTINQKGSYHNVYNNNHNNGHFEEHTREVTERRDDVYGQHDIIEMMDNHNLDNARLPVFDKPTYVTGRLANVGGKLPSHKQDSKLKTNGILKQESKVALKKPIPTKASTPPRTSSSVSSTSSRSPRDSPARSENNNMASKQVPSAQSNRAPTSNRPSAKQSAKSPVVRDDLAECRFCGRRFATDRIGTHEDICGKTGKKKRKAYDATKHRVTGTELEGYVLRGGKKGASNKVSAKQSAPKGNWRKTHEEFIAAIRAAKQAQAYVAKGGKLTDLPPPPPSTNPDYVQCPHCGRRFNEAAAQRHIPKCATYDFNKKNGAPPKSRTGKR